MNKIIKKSIFLSLILLLLNAISLINLLILISHYYNFKIIVIFILLNQIIAYSFGYHYSRFSIFNYVDSVVKSKSDKESFIKVFKKI